MNLERVKEKIRDLEVNLNFYNRDLERFKGKLKKIYNINSEKDLSSIIKELDEEIDSLIEKEKILEKEARKKIRKMIGEKE